MTIRGAMLGAGAALALFASPVAAQDAAETCAPQDTASLSAWQGVWLPEGLDTDITGRFLARGSKFVGFDAPWNEEGWERVRANLALFGSGEYRVIGFGFPAMLDTAGELSFYVGHNQTVILNVYRDVQVIHTDGRDHVPEEEAFTSTWGSSVGCWDGDTLNIDTRYAHFDPAFSPGHAPLSDEARFNWSLRLVEPGKIAMRMSIIDPVYLTEPWVVENTILKYDSAESLLLDGSNNDRSELVAGSQTISAAGSNLATLPDMAPSMPLTAAQMSTLAGDYIVEGAGTAISIAPREGRLWVTMPLLSESTTTTPLFIETPHRAVGLVGHVFEFAAGEDGAAASVKITSAGGSTMTARRVSP